MSKVKGLVLLSGGLDSILAVKVLQQQNIEITGLTFVSYFFNAESAKKAAKSLKIPLRIIDFSDEHLEMVKNPKRGYGRNMNPCLDCHLMMLKKSKEIMEENSDGRVCIPRFRHNVGGGLRCSGADFVATGEVLGERPFSQNQQALKLIEKESGLTGYLLRPLSAKLLEPTILEQQGLIERDKLLDIQGRSRIRQLTLAKERGIKEYPTPAGGCLLTDPGFSSRLKEMFKNWPGCDGNDIELIKLGRHFWERKNSVSVVPNFIRNSYICKKFVIRSKNIAQGADVLIVVGRDQEENQKLEKLVQSGDILIKLKDIPGPTTLVRDKYSDGRVRIAEAAGGGALFGCIKKAEQLTQYYSTKARGKKSVRFLVIDKK